MNSKVISRINQITFIRLYAHYTLIKFVQLLELKQLRNPFRELKRIKSCQSQKKLVKYVLNSFNLQALEKYNVQVSFKRDHKYRNQQPLKINFPDKFLDMDHLYSKIKKETIAEIFHNARKKMINPLIESMDSQDAMSKMCMKITKNYINDQLVDKKNKSKLVKQIQYMKMQKAIKPMEYKNSVIVKSEYNQSGYMNLMSYYRSQKSKMIQTSKIDNQKISDVKHYRSTADVIWLVYIIIIIIVAGIYIIQTMNSQ